MNLETLKDSMPNLHSAAVSEKELFDKSIDFTRPLKEYPTASFIANFIKAGNKPEHVYTDSINVGGQVVQDAMEKYLANEALSSSMLKAALKTPLHFEFAKSEDKEALEDLKGTPACFNLGTFLHQAILEPTKFERVIIEPKYALNTTEGVDKMIEYWENFFTERGFGYIIDEEVQAPEIIDFCKKQVTELLELKLEKIDGKRAYIKVLESCSGVEAVTQENFI